MYNSLTFQVKDAIEPVWMDLAYVPHHGASNYANSEFFKRVRARYYVFSGVEPSKEVFNALLEAKKTWENKEQGKEHNFKSTVHNIKSLLSYFDTLGEHFANILI